MLRDLHSLLIAAICLRKQDLPISRLRIWNYYLYFRCKSRWLKMIGANCTEARFFGFQVQFSDYGRFVYLFEEIFVNGTYFFRPTTSEPTVVDCGSNIGLSILYLKLICPEAMIIGFEAAKETFALLTENIQRNNLSRVELHNIALADHSGEVSFYAEGTGSLSASLFAGRSLNQGLAVTVPCHPLSNFVNNPIDFMKMDIEGAELLCIPEMARAGKLGMIREMVVECHHNLPNNVDVLSKILPTLEGGGYSYQVGSVARLPAVAGLSQDVTIYACRKLEH